MSYNNATTDINLTSAVEGTYVSNIKILLCK